ncbi:plasmid pRiA4b ORF-3 family protein [soil metagenome]
MEKLAYQLKVTLRGTRPPIWRRVEVPGRTTLSRLHDVIQIAMGWTDSHLHQFVAAGVMFGVPDPEWDMPVKRSARVRLDQVLRVPKDDLIYEYDFGDGWEHRVVLEKVLPLDAARHRQPLVTGGRRACPPEDCGGVGGYYAMLAILDDPANPEHDEMLAWVGGGFDAEHFDPEAANARFRA